VKKLIITLYTVIVAITFTNCSKEEMNPGENLPNEVKAYIITHFHDQLITEAKKNENDSINTYEIRLGNLTDLEFNYKFEIMDIDGKTKIPNSVISEKISNYVILNYPDNFITGWEMDEGKQEVELDNAMDLEFDMNNNFMQIDITP